MRCYCYSPLWIWIDPETAKILDWFPLISHLLFLLQKLLRNVGTQVAQSDQPIDGCFKCVHLERLVKDYISLYGELQLHHPLADDCHSVINSSPIKEKEEQKCKASVIAVGNDPTQEENSSACLCSNHDASLPKVPEKIVYQIGVSLSTKFLFPGIWIVWIYFVPISRFPFDIWKEWSKT